LLVFSSEIVSSRLLSKTIETKGHKNVPIVWYGCETYSLILWEKRRLRVFDGRVLKRVFGPKRDEVVGRWRKLHNGDLGNSRSSPNRMIKSARMKLAGPVARIATKRSEFKVLVGRSESKRPL
jgi:hypothetical protein